MAANGKHSPEQIPDLVVPLVEEGFDLVRGSRHSAGAYHENIPWHRQILTLVFTCLFNLFLWTKVTDATGGFQAYRLSVLDDPRIDLWQPWLGRYEVETYLFAKLLMLGYRWKEVPVRITYPARGQTYTRARVVIDWWGYFRPVVLLSLRIKH
jgi:dolichol-phosphate mannosyltransferase